MVDANKLVERAFRVGHDDVVVRFARPPADNMAELSSDGFSVTVNGTQKELSVDMKKRVAFLCSLLFRVGELAHGALGESWLKTNFFVEDLTVILEKYCKVQIGLVISPQSAVGELEARTFEDLMRDVVLDVVQVKKEITEVKKELLAEVKR